VFADLKTTSKYYNNKQKEYLKDSKSSKNIKSEDIVLSILPRKRNPRDSQKLNALMETNGYTPKYINQYTFDRNMD